MKQIETTHLNITYRDVGPSDGKPIFLMHGFPYDVHSYDDVSVGLADAGFRCIIPYLRGYGPTRFLSPDVLRSGQQAALGADLVALMDGLGITKAIVSGYDWGGRAACIVAALWPERVSALVSCGQGYNIQNVAGAKNPAPPEEESRYWYQYYFHTERGRAGLSENRYALCKFIWQIWSPTWQFDETTYGNSAAAFENPDFVDIVVHSYCHRFGGVWGDSAFDHIEAQLAKQPPITVPSIILQGADDGVDPPTKNDDDAHHFTEHYERRIISGAGHNLPQEKPAAFVDAVMQFS